MKCKNLAFTIYPLPLICVLHINLKRRKLKSSFNIEQKLFGEIMYKKSIYLTAVVCASIFVGCHSGPTILNSTSYKHEGETNASHNSMNHDSMNRGTTGEHSEMNHSEMQSAPNAASQPFDLQFLDTMIAHHDGAIQMAKAATTKSDNAELKAFADKMVADQMRETIEMKKLREQFYAGKPSAMNMGMAGMTASMEGMDASKLAQASGNPYNLEFVNQMIPHHEGAVVMAKEAQTKSEHAELKTLANQIIKEQETEIKMMQDWKAKWTK